MSPKSYAEVSTIFPKSEKNKGKSYRNITIELSAPELDIFADLTKDLVSCTLYFHTQENTGFTSSSFRLETFDNQWKNNTWPTKVVLQSEVQGYAVFITNLVWLRFSSSYANPDGWVCRSFVQISFEFKFMQFQALIIELAGTGQVVHREEIFHRHG